MKTCEVVLMTLPKIGIECEKQTSELLVLLLSGAGAFVWSSIRGEDGSWLEI